KKSQELSKSLGPTNKALPEKQDSGSRTSRERQETNQYPRRIERNLPPQAPEPRSNNHK
ncbi:11232_t:CDS:2, partial [Gigaspora rosea]